MNEFSLIARYFSNCGHSQYAVDQDIGDDAAVLNSVDNAQLVMTMDTLIEGVHFPVSTSPSDIAHKALIVNLSDLAAMGADPAWFLLSISLPSLDESWLQQFSDSLKQQAEKYAIKLIGGDTCKGPLSITIQATGVVTHKAVLRATAEVGDHIFVSGELGRAAMALAFMHEKIDLNESDQKEFKRSLNCPNARFDVANVIKPFAHSMIDLSDGLLADLGHILQRSDKGAELYLDQIPMPKQLRETKQLHYALSGGDDYELCFSVPPKHLQKMKKNCEQNAIKLYDIGLVTDTGFTLYQDQSKQHTINLTEFKGYQHFG